MIYRYLCFCLFLLLPFSVQAGKGAEHDLVGKMGAMQYFLHKTFLALNSNNIVLADFYVHELEETFEEVEKIKRYKKYPIAKLAKKLLEPKITALAKSIDSKNLANAKKSLSYVVEACNQCHRSTKHEFINIELRDINPYMQNFSR